MGWKFQIEHVMFFQGQNFKYEISKKSPKFSWCIGIQKVICQWILLYTYIVVFLVLSGTYCYPSLGQMYIQNSEWMSTKLVKYKSLSHCGLRVSNGQVELGQLGSKMVECESIMRVYYIYFFSDFAM